jgi:streptomycin 6-kinase
LNTVDLPQNLIEGVGREEPGWLATVLPPAIARARDLWSLTLGEPFRPGGQTAWVAPARDALGAEFVLKVAFPHPEAAHEADGLRAWAGQGAVLLFAARDVGGAHALLIERCLPGTELSARPEPDQDTVIATLLRRLWIEPGTGHPFGTLEQMCQRWADEFEQATAEAPALGLDPGLARAGIALFRELPATAADRVLLCTDLHAGNVLAATREPWLAVDPKPHVGDPAYDPLQHMLNCEDRLHADPRSLAGRMAGLLDLDPDRVRRWLFARCVQESAGCSQLADVARVLAP